MAAYFQTATMTFLVSGVLLFHDCYSDVKCRNSHKEVDWYILYKLPQNNKQRLTYLYMDDSTNGWRPSKERINSESGCLANTLRPYLDFNDTTEGFGYILYNDQPPFQAISTTYGHSKGVVMFDRHSGVWLSHSTPKFPQNKTHFWPESGNRNGQIFMCVTLPFNQVNEIAIQLKVIRVYPYDSYIPNEFPVELERFKNPKFCPNSGYTFRVKTLTSTAGQDFISFAKSRRFMNDLYSGLIVNYTTQPLYVKSWGRMRRPLASIPHHVYNVETVQVENELINATKDHSKWCVTSDGGWVCIADMNREESQKERGGGAICINNTLVGRVFYQLIPKTEG